MVGNSATAFTGGYPLEDEPAEEGQNYEDLFAAAAKTLVHDASRVSGRKIRASALEAYSLGPAALEMDSKAKGFASLNISGE